MISADKIECTIQTVKEYSSDKADCLITVTTDPTAWEIWSTVANWGILIVAFFALRTAARQRKDTKIDMEKALLQSTTNHAEQLAASEESLRIQINSSHEIAKQELDLAHRSTQAQLDAAARVAQEDLKERRDSRELDLTAETISDLDNLLFTSFRSAGEAGRGEALRSATLKAYNSAGRYQMFVGNPRAVVVLQEEFSRMLDKFTPKSMDDLHGAEHARLLFVHGCLRTLYLEFRANKTDDIYYLLLIDTILKCRRAESWESLDAFMAEPRPK